MQVKDKNGKYDSIRRIVNLPKLRFLNRPTQSILDKASVSEQEKSLISPQLQSARNQLIQRFEKDVQVFAQDQFEFKFPQSKFPDVPKGSVNTINYVSREVANRIQVFDEHLSEDQLQQIKRNGQFKVKSTEDGRGLPHVWKINDCLFKGQVNRANIWQDGLASSYEIIMEAKQFFVQSVPQSFIKIVKTPIQFFSLIFGKKSLTSIYSTNIDKEIYKQFWSDIMNNQLKDIKSEIGHQFLQTLFLKYQSTLYKQLPKSATKQHKNQYEKIRADKNQIFYQQKNKIDDYKKSLINIQSKFVQYWLKIRKTIYSKIQKQFPEGKERNVMKQTVQTFQITSQKILQSYQQKNSQQRLNQQKFLIYIAFLNQNLKKQIPSMSLKIIQAILNLLTLFNIIESHTRIKYKKINQMQQKIRQQIKQTYPIRSRNHTFFQNTFNQMNQPSKNQMQNEYHQKLMNNQKLDPNFKKILKKYIQLCKNFNRIRQKKKQNIKQFFVSTRQFKTTYILLPPYQVKKDDHYYYLQKQKEMKMNTGHHFWKCSLYAMRLKSWCLNCIKFLLFTCWYGRFGFRCLCGFDDFVYQQHINSTNGKKQLLKRQTLVGVFLVVLQGITQSRNDFQSQPDQGLFGKKCSRLCNLIQCYIFRFFFVGVIGVLVLYPIAIILISSITFIGVLTFWIYVPLAMLITYLFNILVYQFQSSDRNQQCIFRIFPLFAIIFKFIFFFAKIIAAILFLLFIAPLVCFFYLIFLVLQRGTRAFTDAIMLCLIGCLGRTPRRNTRIASRISGPGMSYSHFYSVDEEDVYILVQSSLEKILADKFITLTRKSITRNLYRYEKMQRFVLKPFGLNQSNIQNQRKLVKNNNNKVLNDFNQKANFYLNRYPKNPTNIRFTQQQINLYFQNSVKIVRNFVEKNRIENWIFDEQNVIKGDYQQLTRKLWYQIFGCGQQIFKGLQDIDSRFRLVDEANDNNKMMRKNIQYVIKALRGEVQLNKPTASIKPSSLQFSLQDYQLEYIKRLCDIHSFNSLIEITVRMGDPTCLLVPHRNLDQLKFKPSREVESTYSDIDVEAGQGILHLHRIHQMLIYVFILV